MRVLMSIKPEFASMIFDGSERYEFRRMCLIPPSAGIFKQLNVTKEAKPGEARRSRVVYASSPIAADRNPGL